MTDRLFNKRLINSASDFRHGRTVNRFSFKITGLFEGIYYRLREINISEPYNLRLDFEERGVKKSSYSKWAFFVE